MFSLPVQFQSLHLRIPTPPPLRFHPTLKDSKGEKMESNWSEQT